MKKLIVTLLLTSVFTVGCGLKNKEETLSQNEIIQQTNQGVNQETSEETSLNNEEAAPQSKTQEDQTEKLHPIEIEEQECMKKVGYTTTGMSECSYKAMDMWFKEIDKYLGLLKTVTSEEDYSNILKAQEDWKKYQESEFVALSIIMNKQGTIFQNILSGKERGLVKQRALDLRNFYETLAFD